MNYIESKELSNPDEKSSICNTILRALPDWFGIEASIVDYVEQVQSMLYIATSFTIKKSYK